MPKIKRRRLPPRLLAHLLARMRERNVPYDQLILLAKWLDTESDVASGKWFKRFPALIVCGEGDLVKTFLVPGQLPEGEEVQ